ncbi:MAG: hypothetical protein WCR02_06525 [Sphaerochaetaceae bacterium]
MITVNYQQVQNRCSLFNEGFEKIQNSLQTWCLARAPFKDTIKKLIKADTNVDSLYPNLWFSFQAQSFAYASLLCNPQLLKKWSLDSKNLPSASQEVVSYLLQKPAIWCYFTILNTIEKDVYSISDRLSGATLTLYSPALSAKLYKKEMESKHFLALLSYNGECYQNFGVIHSNNLGASDLDFFCTLLDQQAYMSQGVTMVVNNHFLDFFAIDEVANVPSMIHGGTWLKMVYNKINIEDFDENTLIGTWKVEKHNGRINAILREPNDELLLVVPDARFWADLHFSRPALILDTKSGEGWIQTTGKESYEPFTRILRHLFLRIPLDKVVVPDYVVSPSMIYLMNKQGRKSPWSEIIKGFEDSGPTDEESALIASTLGKYVLDPGKSSSESKRHAPNIKEEDREYELTMNPGISTPMALGFASSLAGEFAQEGQAVLDLLATLLCYNAGTFIAVRSYIVEIKKYFPLVDEQDLKRVITESLVQNGMILQENSPALRIAPSKTFLFQFSQK